MVESTNKKSTPPGTMAKQASVTTTDSKVGGAKLARLAEIERQMQEQFAELKLYETQATEGCEKMTFDGKQASKFFGTFPFPYMNGYLHLGHGFTLAKVEFMARYQRQRGKNVLFPFAFHCTGMPIGAAALRLSRELKTGATSSGQPTPEEYEKLKKQNKDYEKPQMTQYEVLQTQGIPDEDIPAFQDPNHWLEFFPPIGQATLKRLGIHTDWRRSFITTERNPYYDAFIRWQFHHLKEAGKVRFGKRHAIYSEVDGQPCADHDRAKGEGVAPQEYTGIKLKLLDLPPSLKKFQGKDLYLVAATLRPETMYGQTNCFVLPTGEYGVYKMAGNGGHVIVSERSARNMAFQELTAEPKKYPCLASVKGADLVGKRVKAPLAKYDHVYVLPLPTISMGKGTGVVTSVPSDAPDDYMMLWGLQTKPGLRAELGVDEAWVKGFDPVPIIEIPEMGNLSAKFACEELKVASYKEKDKLAQAKDRCYLKGFTDGVCLVGIGKGTKVEAAKPVVKQHMVEAGDAFLYYEPEGEVAARSAPDVQCVVALCDQWLLGYGEEGWKNKVKEHIQSDDFQTYNPKTQHEFDLILDWLKEWGCSRTTGLGTRLPWDPKFVIESLSDSTIYGAFYTIAHLLQGEGNLDGSRTGPGGIPADKLNIAAFDYIFLGKPFNKKKMPGLSEAKLKALRKEFEFWYPMDLRVSGKDLIRNHLTMSLYNHQAIWQDPKKMVRSYFCNGWLMIDHKKMSKSTGNFLQLSDALDSYGADASRVCLADCGDSLDDANFERTVANAAVLKLYTFEQWVQQHVPKSGKDLDFAKIDPSTYTTWDKIVLNELNAVIVECANDYDQMRFKAVVKTAFSELLGLKETYVLAVEWPHPAVIYRYMEVMLTLMNPITPHFAQFIWQTYVYPRLQESKNAPKKYEEFLVNAGWPKQTGDIDPVLSAIYSYLKHQKHEFQVSLNTLEAKDKKKKKKYDKVSIFVGLDFPEYKLKVLDIMKKYPSNESTIAKDKEGFTGDYKKEVREAFPPGPTKTSPETKLQQEAMIFAAFVSHEARVHGREIALNTQMPFDEAQVINEHKSFLFEHMEKQIHEIKVYAKTDKAIESIPGGAEAAAGAVPSKPVCLFAESTPSIPEESTQPKGKGDKGGAGGKGGKGDKGGKGGKGGDGDKGGKGGKQEAGKPKGAPAAGGKKPNPAFDQIEGQLANSIWIGGQNPTQADNVAFESMKNPPDADANPVAFGWYNLCRQFTPEVRGSWPAGAAPSGGKGEKGGKGDKGGKSGKQSTKKKEDDIDDLFASDDEEETKAAAEALKKKGEDAKKKGAKPKPVARSLVIWEVKPWGPETDLDALGKKILAEVKMDGLVWKSEFKKEPVAYGVFKIVIGATVEDEKVSTDDVQEAIEAFDDFVQSVDILAFNKL